MIRTTPRRLSRAVTSVVLLALLLAAGPAAAKIAVFVDGRILRVEDAYIEGRHIVLLLADEAWMRVPATRIDRVVADEVSSDEPEPAISRSASCKPGWVDAPLPEGTPYRDEIRQAARNADLHPLLLASLVRAESAYNPTAVSRAGACGLTQLMPAAVQQHRVSDVWDPQENLRGGASHLRLLLDRFETLPLALAAYNAGGATVERSGGIPPYRETQTFVRRVMGWFCDDGEPAEPVAASAAPGQ